MKNGMWKLMRQGIASSEDQWLVDGSDGIDRLLDVYEFSTWRFLGDKNLSPS